MQPTRLRVKNSAEIKSYIENFPLDDVVLKNYFYFTEKNLFKESDIYTDDQLGAILNLTDREYADLVLKYFNTGELVSTDTNLETQKKIEELEAKLAASKNIEESGTRVKEIEEELKELNKKLETVSVIQEKYEASLAEYQPISYLSKFNLPKLHEDLLNIINETNKLESDLLNFKGVQIQEMSKKTGYDKGKVGLGVGLFIAIFLAGIGLIVLNMPFSFVLGLWGVAAILMFLTIYMAKIELDYPMSEEAEGISEDYLKQNLEELRRKKKKILDIVGTNSSDEFFNMKAKLGALVKTLKYLQEQRTQMLEGMDYDELMNKQSSLQNELNEFQNNLNNGGALKPEEYLSTRREIDYLKLSLNQAKQNTGLAKPQIVDKLAAIRKELLDKLPEFCSILKQNFKSSFTQIKTYFDDLCVKFNIKQPTIDAEGNGFDEMTRIEKVLVQFSLFKEIYQTDFAFAVEYLSKWDESDRDVFKKFVDSVDPVDARFYVLEES